MVLDEFLQAANENAAAIQALASIAALVVAGIAAWIAHGAREAEKRQAQVANEALKAARDSDRSRQRETQILAIRPLLLDEPTIMTTYRIQGVGDVPMALIDINLPTDSPVLGLGVVVRLSDDREGPTIIQDFGSSAPGTRVQVRFRLEDLLTDAAFDPVEVVAQYRGSLGQWVYEHYHWYLHKRIRDETGLHWRLARLQIITTAEGMPSLNMGFGGVADTANM